MDTAAHSPGMRFMLSCMWALLLPSVLNPVFLWSAPSGVTSVTTSTTSAPFALERKQMVEDQLRGPGRDIKNRAVLAAMESVPRHEFVPAAVRGAAYGDYPLPIGYGQTISQPYIVAFMTEQLALKPTDRVLEIGTGSGYQAAILASIVAEVYSIEIIAPLAQQASNTLARLGYKNVKVKAGDGYQGWAEHAPYEGITVTCAPEKIPQPLVDQLKEGGRMVIPVGGHGQQNLYVLEKRGGAIRKRAVLPVRFVPMTGLPDNASPTPTH